MFQKEFKVKERVQQELHLVNQDGDILVIHPSLVYDTLETEEEEMERISKEQDMDEDYYDFSNPGSMRKRQKELLRRVEAYRE